jgi:NADPH2:quinone reductase
MSGTTTPAVVMREYGDPEVLVLSEMPLAPLAAHEVRIRAAASAVNHTDLEIRAGKWPIAKAQPFPYVPGVEVVGVVEERGSAVLGLEIGQQAITMMQGLGGVRSERPGGYARQVAVSAEAVAAIPAGVDLKEMAAVGLVGVTAYEALAKMGPLAGRRIGVTGAAGGVGSAAIGIARAQGAAIVAVINHASQADYVRSLGADEVRVAKSGGAALPAGSVDGILDAVAGPGFGKNVAALRSGGVLCLVGAVGGAAVAFDAWELIRPVTLTGYSSESLTGADLRSAISQLSVWLLTRKLRAPRARLMPLAQAAEAHRLMEAGGVQGRILLSPR